MKLTGYHKESTIKTQTCHYLNQLIQHIKTKKTHIEFQKMNQIDPKSE